MGRGPSFAAMGRAGEAEWNRTLAEENVIKEEIKVEAANLQRSYEYLKKTYGDKKPVDFKGNYNALIKLGADLFNFFSSLRARVERMIAADLTAEDKLKTMFGRMAREYSVNMIRLDAIKQKQKRIIAELDSLVKYWEHIKNNGSLPFAYFTNRKDIAEMVASITKEELSLVLAVDKLMRTTTEIRYAKKRGAA